jgi:hypothetical protein
MASASLRDNLLIEKAFIEDRIEEIRRVAAEEIEKMSTRLHEIEKEIAALSRATVEVVLKVDLGKQYSFTFAPTEHISALFTSVPGVAIAKLRVNSTSISRNSIQPVSLFASGDEPVLAYATTYDRELQTISQDIDANFTEMEQLEQRIERTTSNLKLYAGSLGEVPGADQNISIKLGDDLVYVSVIGETLMRELPVQLQLIFNRKIAFPQMRTPDNSPIDPDETTRSYVQRTNTAAFNLRLLNIFREDYDRETNERKLRAAEEQYATVKFHNDELMRKQDKLTTELFALTHASNGGRRGRRAQRSRLF